MAKHREFQKHKDWASKAVMAEAGRNFPPYHGRVRLAVTVYPKTKNQIDSDNAAAAMKAYSDGVALALRINDSRFVYAPINFGLPVKHGMVVITISEAA